MQDGAHFSVGGEKLRLGGGYQTPQSVPLASESMTAQLSRRVQCTVRVADGDGVGVGSAENLHTTISASGRRQASQCTAVECHGDVGRRPRGSSACRGHFPQ